MSLHNWLLILIAAATGLAPSASNAGIIASSHFNLNHEGWFLSGDPTSPTPTYVAAGGNPGGFIRGADALVNNVWYFNAPGKFLGDVSASYGFTLTFDLRAQSFGNPPYNWDDVILISPTLSLYFDNTAAIPQAGPWTSYSVPLSEGTGWTVGSLGTGGTPTQAQFQQVLTNLSGLRIRGEFFSGPDSGDLDNVVLNGANSAVPEPGSLTLFGLALAGLVGRAFARKKKLIV
jgi:hypothetical protein